jgi:LCP family protein required for cell wall assembly
MTSPLPERVGPRARSLVISIALGLCSGLLLSIPLASTLLPNNGERLSLLGVPVSNPFSAWTGIGDREVVVLGMDAGGGNTDTIFTIRVENGQTEIIQIPRDSYINSARFGPMKVNALYAYGGTDAVKQELSRLMGRPIQHHILVNLEGIRTISDLMGGVTVDVPKRLYYVDNAQGLYIDLQPGPQLLKGRELEGFLRWRNDGEGDFGRLQRQQLVIKSLFASLTKPENVMRLPALITAAGRNLKTDLGPMELGGLISAMGTTDLNTERLQATPFDRDGISYLDTQWPASDGGRQNSASPEAPSNSWRKRPLF